MYDTLAPYYDALVKDEEATKQYVDFIHKHSKASEVLELACGSGEISLSLAQSGSNIDATDISEAMLEVAKQKDSNHLVNYEVLDMSSFKSAKKYDTVLCLCDSINYLDEEKLSLMFKSVYEVLDDQGVFIFDMHSQDRLREFENEFYEAGVVEGMEYTWSIISEEKKLFHTFIFYDESAHPRYEHHVQNIFDVQVVTTLLKQCGFEVAIYTDFNNDGIVAGEKYFYICRKESL